MPMSMRHEKDLRRTKRGGRQNTHENPRTVCVRRPRPHRESPPPPHNSSVAERSGGKESWCVCFYKHHIRFWKLFFKTQQELRGAATSQWTSRPLTKDMTKHITSQDHKHQTPLLFSPPLLVSTIEQCAASIFAAHTSTRLAMPFQPFYHAT